jgi:hypothetical protein
MTCVHVKRVFREKFEARTCGFGVNGASFSALSRVAVSGRSRRSAAVSGVAHFRDHNQQTFDGETRH